MKEINSLFSISGEGLIQYNSEKDWIGSYFDSFPNATILRNCAGIYVFTLCGEIVYIGSSINLLNRLRTHTISIQHGDNCHSLSVADRKYYYFNQHISNVEFHVVETYNKNISKQELELYEYEYINRYLPIFNVNYVGSVKRWLGTDQDIDNFINATLSMDDLKAKLRNDTKL